MLRNSIQNAFPTKHLFRLSFAWEIRNRRIQIAFDTFAVRMVCRVKISSLTGGSQQPVVDKQTKMLPGSPRDFFFTRPERRIVSGPGERFGLLVDWLLTTPGEARCFYPDTPCKRRIRNRVKSTQGAGKQQLIPHSTRVSQFYSQNIRFFKVLI